MEEINEQFNTDSKKKKTLGFYLGVIVLAVIIISAIVFTLTADKDVLNTINNNGNDINTQEIKKDLMKSSEVTLTEEDKEKFKNELTKPSSFTLSEEEKQKARELLAQ